MKSPLRYSMMERRFLYKLAELVRQRYKEMGLAVRESWDNLLFRVTDKELKEIGGDKHAVYVYGVLEQLANRMVTQYSFDEDGHLVLGRFHWITKLEWKVNTRDYIITVSPDLYDYVCNLTGRFTRFDTGVGIRLRSKYSQKFYEICCMYTSDDSHPYRYKDNDHPEYVYKERVVRLSFTDLRTIFGLDEVKDPRTGKIVERRPSSQDSSL